MQTCDGGLAAAAARRAGGASQSPGGKARAIAERRRRGIGRRRAAMAANELHGTRPNATRRSRLATAICEPCAARRRSVWGESCERARSDATVVGEGGGAPGGRNHERRTLGRTIRRGGTLSPAERAGRAKRDGAHEDCAGRARESAAGACVMRGVTPSGAGAPHNCNATGWSLRPTPEQQRRSRPPSALARFDDVWGADRTDRSLLRYR